MIFLDWLVVWGVFGLALLVVAVVGTEFGVWED